MGLGNNSNNVINFKEVFTEKELLVLFHLVQGKTNTEIGKDMDITPHTVKMHLNAIFKKLNVDDRVSAAVVVTRGGIFEEYPELLKVYLG